jgi:hypothetical protein
MNSVKKLLSYTNSKHNILAVVFVLLVLLVAQHPNLFSQPINSVWGKLLVLIIVLLLTHYNIVAGLVATISVIGLHIYLHDSGYEGFTEGMCPDPNDPTCPKVVDPPPSVASIGKAAPAPLTSDGKTATSLAAGGVGAAPTVDGTPSGTVAPALGAAAPAITSGSKTAGAPAVSMVDKKLAAESATKSQQSSSLPITKGTSDKVEANSPTTGTLNASLIKQ